MVLVSISCILWQVGSCSNYFHSARDISKLLVLIQWQTVTINACPDLTKRVIWENIILSHNIINRTSVAGNVLQRPMWNVEISSNHCLSQTLRARELKFQENIHPSPHVTWYMLCVKIYFRRYKSCIFIFFIFFGGGGGWGVQSCGASRWRVCYQQGLPRLVRINLVRFYCCT